MPSDHTEIRTERLVLCRFEPDATADQDFVLELLNQRSFIDNIADRGVRTRADAAAYLRDGPYASYERFGFGLMRVERREDGAPIGMCGLLKRDYFDYPDVGYALLDAHAGKGYAREAASATVAWGFARFGPRRIAASTAPHNAASIGLLLSLGFEDLGLVQLPAYPEPSRYFEIGPAAAR
jgi:RimJ/RimL family protein N-acetyltransferase